MFEKRAMVRWIIDITVYVIVIIAWRNVDSVVPKTVQPFVCGDKSIALPYKRSTIRGAWLHYYFYGIMFLIFLIELALERKSHFKQKLVKVFIRVLRWFKYYFICFLCLVIVSSTIKNQYGSLRPFFLEVCKPDKAEYCYAGDLKKDYKCTSTEYSEYILSEAQRSFPSGHAYSVFYTSVFLILYIQSRFTEMPSKLLVVFVHAIIIILTSFCCITRISDNWHYPVDVIGGCLITIPFVLYSSLFLCKNFKRSDQDE